MLYIEHSYTMYKESYSINNKKIYTIASEIKSITTLSSCFLFLIEDQLMWQILISLSIDIIIRRYLIIHWCHQHLLIYMFWSELLIVSVWYHQLLLTISPYLFIMELWTSSNWWCQNYLNTGTKYAYSILL